MRLLPTIIIAALASVLTMAAIYDVQGSGLLSVFSTKARTNNSNFLHVNLESTKSIRIEPAAQQALLLTKNTGDAKGWRLSEPQEDRADPRKLTEIAKFISKSTIVDSLPLADSALEDFGLGKNETKLFLYDSSGNTLCQLAIGDISPWRLEKTEGKKTSIDTTLYARLLDSDQSKLVYIITDPGQNIQTILGNDVKRLRDHRPFFCLPSQIQKISIKSLESEILIERKTQQSPWRITKPLSLKTDTRAMTSLVQAIIRLEATELENTESTPISLEEAKSSISIETFGKEPPIELKLLAPVNNKAVNIPAIVSDRDVTFLLPLHSSQATSGISAFPSSVNQIRHRALTSINPKGLKSIVIRGKNREDIFLTREQPDDEWQQFGRSGLEEIDESTLYSFIIALSKMPVEAFISDAATDPSQWDLNAPDLGIAFVGFDNEAFRLAFKRNEEGKILAIRVGEPHLKQISEEAYSAISRSAMSWRNKRLWSISRVDIENISLQQTGESAAELQYNFVTEAWTAKVNNQDKTPELIPARANKLLDRIENIIVKGWLGKRHRQAFEALLDPSFVIDITAADEETGDAITRSLRLTPIAKTPQNQFFYGHLSGETDYFIIDLKTYEALTVELFERE